MLEVKNHVKLAYHETNINGIQGIVILTKTDILSAVNKN